MILVLVYGFTSFLLYGFTQNFSQSTNKSPVLSGLILNGFIIQTYLLHAIVCTKEVCCAYVSYILIICQIYMCILSFPNQPHKSLSCSIVLSDSRIASFNSASNPASFFSSFSLVEALSGIPASFFNASSKSATPIL